MIRRSLIRFSQHPAVTQFGRRMGHAGKRLFGAVFNRLMPVPAAVPLESLSQVRRVLFVRPNFRIGNTLIAMQLIAALRTRFPGAEVDYLGGDTTVTLLDHAGVDHVYCVSRHFVLRPWQFIALFVRLRRRRYDVAIEGGLGSFSGGLFVFLTGARYRLGTRGRADHFLNVRVPPVHVEHAYDKAVAFAREIGVSCLDHPVYQLTAEDRAVALRVLREIDFAEGDRARPFIGIFVGGHQRKRIPAASWLRLARALRDAGGRVVVFLGPEEADFESHMREGLPGTARVLRPQPLQVFAAVWATARLIITPDSGPMHLAAALDVPAIALLQTEASRHYCPRSAADRALVGATVEEAVSVVRAHPRWAEVVDPGAVVR